MNDISFKMTNNLAISLNGGLTEGTSLFTYNGSVAKSIIITPQNIGAALASHGTHVAYGTSTTSLVSGGSGTIGTSSTVARSDHTHTLPAYPTIPDTVNYLIANDIPANTNLNDVIKPGFYRVQLNATVATLFNSPTTQSFFMIVGQHAGIYQELVEYTISGQKKYFRNFYSGNWGAWNRIYTTLDKPALGDIGAAPVSHGIHVPALQAPDNKRFLRNDNTWQLVTPGNIGAAVTNHTHGYLPVSGGTLTGDLRLNSNLSVRCDNFTTGGGVPLISGGGNALEIGNGNQTKVSIDGSTIMIRAGVSGTAAIDCRTDSNGVFMQSDVIYDRTYSSSAVSTIGITSSGTLGRISSSSKKYKKDIHYLSKSENGTIKVKTRKARSISTTIEPKKVLDIPVADFKYIDGYITGDSYDGSSVLGFIVEDIAKVFPEAVIYKMKYEDPETGTKYEYSELFNLDKDRQDTVSQEIESAIRQYKKSKKVDIVPEQVIKTISDEVNAKYPDILGRCIEVADKESPEMWNDKIIVPAILYVLQQQDETNKNLVSELNTLKEELNKIKEQLA